MKLIKTTRLGGKTDRRKVDKLSNGKLACLVTKYRERLHKFQPLLLLPKRTKGAIIDERFNHGDRLPITSQMCFQEILVILIIHWGPTGIYSTKRRIWGPKVMIINEMAGPVETCFRICLRCERLAHWLVQQRGEDLLEFGMFQVLLMETITSRGGFYNIKGVGLENKGISPDIMVEQDAKLVIEGHDPQLEKAVEVALEL
jgi:tricorn protease